MGYAQGKRGSPDQDLHAMVNSLGPYLIPYALEMRDLRALHYVDWLEHKARYQTPCDRLPTEAQSLQNYYVVVVFRDMTQIGNSA